MALFSLFGKESKTENKQETNYTDNSLNAAEGAIAAGEGSNVHIEQLSDDVALGSVAGIQNVSLGALAGQQNVSIEALRANEGTAARALAANRDVNIASLDNAAAVAAHAVNTIKGVNDIAAQERIDVLESTNLALRSQEGATQRITDLADAALERTQTPDSQVTKMLLYVVAVIVVAIAFFLRPVRQTRRKK